MYGAPSGCLLLASRGEEWLGCCALRRFDADVCEMKRLYLQPAARGADLGRRLAEGVVDKARVLGYRRMVLDTLEGMTAAQTLYRSLGFREIEPYYFNPTAGVCYMELLLDLRLKKCPNRCIWRSVCARWRPRLSAAPSAAQPEITLEKIMADPDWIGAGCEGRVLVR